MNVIHIVIIASYNTHKMFLRVCVLVVLVASVQCVEFPHTFSANILTESSWGDHLGCSGLPIVSKVLQCANSTYWSHSVSTFTNNYEEILITVPSNADPVTPQATQLTKFSWKSDTDFKECAYQLYNEKQILPFFGYPTTYLEYKETINGIECEKWSNKGHPGNSGEYWAVWYAINTQPPYSLVVRAIYKYPPSPPRSFPVPGCNITYTFSNFSTAPINPKLFTPPDNWLKKCSNSNQGIKTYNLPDREQGGYICVNPNATNAFEIAILAKPENGSLILNIRPCVGTDYCIYGDGCKDCVQFNTTKLVFTADNWSIPQTILVTYKADGDSQFVFDSPNYYLTNTYPTQFSTCACAGGKCAKKCQEYCE